MPKNQKIFERTRMTFNDLVAGRKRRIDRDDEEDTSPSRPSPPSPLKRTKNTIETVSSPIILDGN